MNWYVHPCTAIDFNWDCLMSVAQAARFLGGHSAALRTGCGPAISPSCEDVERFLNAWESAQRAASKAGWDGDFAQGPGVMWLPDEDRAKFTYAFAFKQKNNGQAFVISPFALGWLSPAVSRPPASDAKPGLLPDDVLSD